MFTSFKKFQVNTPSLLLDTNYLKLILGLEGLRGFQETGSRAGAYPDFCSRKRLGVFLLPPLDT